MSVDDKDTSGPVLPEEEDLPPGVRKHNRCHSSSSSDSEEDVITKQPMDVDSSDSDSDKSDHISTKTDEKNGVEKPRPAAILEKSKSRSKEKEVPFKNKHSRSRSDSRSKSRSRSATPKKGRSTEKSRRSRSRSRSRDRRHKKDRRRRSYRSRSKERRRSRDRHRHKREHKRSRSRSRSRDRRDRRHDRRSSRDRDRRRRSRSRSKRSRSRDRRRDSRSPSPHSGKVIKFGDKVIKPGASFGRPTSSSSSKPVTFKEKMRQQLIKAIEDGADTADVLAHKGGSTICTQSAGVQQQSIPKPKGPPVPLMDTIVPSTASLAAMTVTASEAAMQSMLALQKEATEKTGIEIPKYYNPAAINPMKYAEQVQKRKLLWSKAKDKDVNSQWHATTLSGDADDKSKEKFRKLMGIKEDPASSEGKVEGEEKQKQLFDQLNKEYEFARMATHTHRGVGLGFSSAGYQAPPPPPPTG